MKPRRSASARATVDLPAPAGPSMAMTMSGRRVAAPAPPSGRGVRLSPMFDFARHADRAIYVLIAVMAMTVALEGVETRPGRALGAVIATAVALTLAELFADRVGISIRRAARRPRRSGRRSTARR